MTASRLWQAVLLLLTRVVCGRPKVRGTVPRQPVLLVASHASHADTAAILAALPADIRRRTHPAAAEDHFFRSRARARWTTRLTGAFAFPRHGDAGLRRAAALLAAGHNVVLFPQGSRAGGEFKCGAARLALDGATVIPVGLAGTPAVLPKGSWLPRRHPVAVVFGAPVRTTAGRRAAVSPAARADRGPHHAGLLLAGVDERAITTLLRRRVDTLNAAAAELLPARRPTLLDRARELATSGAGLATVAAWAFLEALILPVVPDVPVALLAVAAPARALPLALAATAGSVAGGAAAWAIGDAHPPLLLVTERMHTTVQGWIQAEGAAALWRQPLGGVPFKVFAYGASDLPLPGLLAVAALARGARIVAVAAGASLVGRALGRVPAQRQALAYAAGSAVALVVFGLGLAQVVAAWR